MENQENPNVNPENVELVKEEIKEVAEVNPIQEKLNEIEVKQDIPMPEPVKEIAEAAINEAAIQAGEKQASPKKVTAKKPTKSDPIIYYDNRPVLWFMEI